MHESVYTWAARQLAAEHIAGKDVIEVGSLDVNGSLRKAVMACQPASYQGIDIRPGPGVDVVMDASDLPEYSADLIICTEMLEHAEHWRAAVGGMYGALNSGGRLLLTTRGPGFTRHDHPNDYWRFTVPLIGRIVGIGLGMALHDLRADPDHPGVFCYAQLDAGNGYIGTGVYEAIPL